MSPRLALLSLLAAAASCSGLPAPELELLPHGRAADAGVGPADAGLPWSAAAYCEYTADFFCDYYLRCGRIVAAGPSECRAVFLETCNGRYEQRYVDLEGAGLLSFSAPGLDACRAHLATVTCSRQLSDLMGPCAGMWEGQQPAGAACGLDVESLTCAQGTRCVLGLNLCGVCKSTAPLGGTCGADAGTCAGDAACVAGRCVARGQVGEPCTANEPCVVGAGCPAGTCVGPSYVREGEPCDLSHRCPYRSTCQGGVCVRQALLGEDCSTRTCASGRCVTDGSGARCQPLLEPGAPCTSPTECRSASCVGGTCRQLPGLCFP